MAISTYDVPPPYAEAYLPARALPGTRFITAGGTSKPAAPTVSAVSPAVGSTLPASDTDVVLDVTAPLDSALLAVEIDMDAEWVFSGSTLDASGYSSGFLGAVTSITNGLRFTLHRAAGWLEGGPNITVRAFDKSGQVTSATFSWIYIPPAPPPPPPTTIQMVRAIDARLLDVIFSVAVVESEALIASNYSISPALTVKSVQKITDLEYVLTTSKQTELENYTVTVSGIHDLNGNPVT